MATEAKQIAAIMAEYCIQENFDYFSISKRLQGEAAKTDNPVVRELLEDVAVEMENLGHGLDV